MQMVYSSQEKDLQKKQRVVQDGDSIRIELKHATEKLTRMRREHLLEMDEQKEKYQTLLHEHTDLERQLTALQLTFEAKEQECMTLMSHNNIQTS